MSQAFPGAANNGPPWVPMLPGKRCGQRDQSTQFLCDNAAHSGSALGELPCTPRPGFNACEDPTVPTLLLGAGSPGLGVETGGREILVP